MKRILRITSHAGKARYLATLTDGWLGWIVRQKDIPSPYAYSPTHGVYHDPKRGAVIIVETSHKRYDVFAVDHDVTTIYATDQLATDAYIAATR
jgi:hypothetical protein